jgi:hypothetical protein
MPLLQAHQLGQHHRARHHRHAFGAGGRHFGVVRFHRGGRDHRLRAFDVRRVMADEHLDAQRRQAARGRAVALVGARHRVAEVVQDLGDAAHAGAADADEMDAFDCVLHAQSFDLSSSATRAAACGRASARAFSAIASSAGRSGLQQIGQALRRQLGLRQVDGRAVLGHATGVVALVRGGADDQRHQHAARRPRTARSPSPRRRGRRSRRSRPGARPCCR